MGDLPLLIFTIFLQASIGLMVFTMIAKLLHKDKEFKLSSLVIVVLSIVGLLASILHLGSPMIAFLSISNLATSWLSREILFSGLFTVLAIIYAVMVYRKSEAKAAINAIGWTASVVGLVNVFSMAKAYEATSIPAWQSANTFVDFYATMIIFGVALLFFTSIRELDRQLIGNLSLTVLIVVGIQVAFAVPHYIQLGLMGGAGTLSAEVLSDMNLLVVAQWLLLVLGAGFLLFSKTQEGNNSLTRYYVTATALSLGLIVGRYMFYAIEVATRVGLT